MSEIERKFLLKKIPKCLQIKAIQHIKQAYPVYAPDRELRVRSVTESKKTRYYVTTKVGRGMNRQEHETEINRGMYYGYLANMHKKLLRKKRLRIEENDRVYEVDIYKHPFLMRGLKVVEVEFDTEEEALAFEPPDWFGEEVTDKIKYKNKHLWQTLNAKHDIISTKLIKGVILAFAFLLCGYLIYRS